MLFAINVTGVQMVALGDINLNTMAIMGSVGNVAGYTEEEISAIMQVGGRIELEASGCKKVVDVWKNCVGQLAESSVIEIYASLRHCMNTGSEWEFHAFRERDEMMEIREARVQAIHLAEDLDEDLARMEKQMEAIMTKRDAVMNNVVRLDSIIAEKEAAK